MNNNKSNRMTIALLGFLVGWIVYFITHDPSAFLIGLAGPVMAWVMRGLALADAQQALDAIRAEARAAALADAAAEIRDWQAFTRYAKERISEEMAQAVLALKETK